MDTVMKALAPAKVADCVFLPFATDPHKARELRGAGWRTVAGLEATDNIQKAAQHLGCSHVLENGTVNKLD
jgi:hypothetical protein